MSDLPKRIRLLQACRDHLYSRVKATLATEREVQALREFDYKINRFNKYLSQSRKGDSNG